MDGSRKRRVTNNNDESISKRKYGIGEVPGYRFLIPSKAAGAMIGKGGEVIKRLRSKYNCRIFVPDSQGPERLVVIDGSPNMTLDVWNDILPSIKEYMSAKDYDYKGLLNRNKDLDDEIDLRLVLHESQAGAVIGKKGERIRNLINKHRMTIIKLYQTFCPNSTDRIVRMVSKIENVMFCLENIFDLLENQVIKGPRKDYNPDDFDESIAIDYGGYISKDFRMAAERNLNNSTANNQLRRNVPNESFETNDYFPSSNVFSRISSRKNVEDRISVARSLIPPQHSPLRNRGTTDLMDGMLRINAISDFSMVHVSHVAVPKLLVSAILGKDGRRLAEIERDSGAEIEIDVDRIDNIETVFTIRGSADQIFKAQCLMQLCARKFCPNDGF